MLFFKINFIPASVRITEVYVISEDTKQDLMDEIRYCSAFIQFFHVFSLWAGSAPYFCEEDLFFI